MTHAIPLPPRKPEGGSVAIEAAICIGFILVPIFAFVLLFGRYFWYYNVAQKAAHDAALYMANAPLTEIKSSKGSAGFANDIITRETSDLDLDTIATMTPTALCGYKVGFSADPEWLNCSPTLTPIGVRAGVVLNVVDPFFSPVTNLIWGTDGVPIIARVNMSYVGH
jgi:hypothetical protein